MKRARELCSKLQPKSLDLLCFPEMAFTGYVFESARHITPFLEQPKTGTTSQFCSSLAQSLSCYVLAGYPEALSESESKPTVADHLSDADSASGDPHADPISGAAEGQSAVGANSSCLFDPDGNWVGSYRKTNMYTTDKTWAKPGSGFGTFSLPSPLSTLSIGICMDLNTLPTSPAWTSLEDGPYELAEYALQNNAKVLVLLNAWLYSSQPQDEGDDGKHDWNTLQYWAARLRPLWAKTSASEGTITSDGEAEKDNEEESDNEAGQETIVVICNRSGTENGSTFAGSSAIFSMVRNSGRPKLLDMMGKDEEGLRVWNISI